MHNAKIEELKGFAKDLNKDLDLLKDENYGTLSFSSKGKRCTFNRIIFCLNEISNYIEYMKERNNILEDGK